MQSEILTLLHTEFALRRKCFPAESTYFNNDPRIHPGSSKSLSGVQTLFSDRNRPRLKSHKSPPSSNVMPVAFKSAGSFFAISPAIINVEAT